MTTTSSPEPETDPSTPDHYADLNAVLEHAWAVLRDGADSRLARAHTPTLATNGLDGMPRIRTVVLRDFTYPACELRFHTDRRSTKIAELQANPRAALHVYDPQQKIQLQIDCHAVLHTDDAVSVQAWENSQPMSQICYQVTKAPGSLIEDPLQAIHDPAIAQGGADNFMVVILQITAIEWLFLDARGHRRARFTREDDSWTGCWLIP